MIAAPCTGNLRLNEKVIAAVRHFAEAGKPVADVCHGAQLLAAADVIRGKRISAYPACAPEVKLAGGTYADIAVTDAVTDGQFVTAPAWPAHPAWLAQFVKLLGTEIIVTFTSPAGRSACRAPHFSDSSSSCMRRAVNLPANNFQSRAGASAAWRKPHRA